MDSLTVFPDKTIAASGVISNKMLELGIHRFIDACSYVHEMPYGYNTDKDDLMVLFEEKQGTCTTKHAVIGTLAVELDIPITKTIGIYGMTEAIVTGTQAILDTYHLPYVPMIHCFLTFERYRVDLTEGNLNGKNRSIEAFLYTENVRPGISEKEEYMLYRKALKDVIMNREELGGIDMKRILQAREEGLKILKENVNRQQGRD